VLSEFVLPHFIEYVFDKFAGTSGTIFITLQILERKEAGTYLQSLNGGIIKREKLFRLEEQILVKEQLKKDLILKD
jgi:hypothetical protein